MNKDWRYWLKTTAEYYKVTQKEVLESPRSRPKSTFYWLIFKAGLDLYKVSIAIGKNKTTIAKFIDNNVRKEINKYRDKSAEDYLLNQSK